MALTLHAVPETCAVDGCNRPTRSVWAVCVEHQRMFSKLRAIDFEVARTMYAAADRPAPWDELDPEDMREWAVMARAARQHFERGASCADRVDTGPSRSPSMEALASCGSERSVSSRR